MSDLEKQKILVLFGGGFFLAGGLMIYSNKPLYSIALFMLSALLIGVVAVGPDSIKTLGFKWGKDGGHIGFDRYQPTEPERELALKLAQDNPSPEIEKKGEKFIEKAEERVPEQRSPEDYLALANEKWRAKDYDAALADVYAGLDLNPKDVRVKASLIFSKGRLFFFLGLRDEAIKHFKDALEVDSEFSWPHVGLGNVYRNQGKLDRAEVEYNKAKELDPNNDKPNIGLGNIYLDQGKLEEAKAAYKRAIELYPNDALPHHGLGNVYLDQGKLEKAEDELKKAMELYPNDAKPHVSLGNVYKDKGEPEKAEAEYNKAMELYPNDAKPHVSQGNLYSDQGKLEEAKKEYEEALQLDPDFTMARENLEKLKRKMEMENLDSDPS
jgi:tetratricopeptide (TPR) repeat protein